MIEAICAGKQKCTAAVQNPRVLLGGRDLATVIQSTWKFLTSVFECNNICFKLNKPRFNEKYYGRIFIYGLGQRFGKTLPKTLDGIMNKDMNK